MGRTYHPPQIKPSYRKNWYNHIVNIFRLPKVLLNYFPKGRKGRGRPGCENSLDVGIGQ